jgi:uncharacterized membrane protein YqaE (UPF0057 family)
VRLAHLVRALPAAARYKNGVQCSTGEHKPTHPQHTLNATYPFIRTTMATLVDILLCILAIILPPLPVLIKRGCGINLLINLLLCVFGLWIGGTARFTRALSLSLLC